ncbi:MAG TPA: lysophospholipase [Planctomycetota bacterium]|nr:lysophospholipase [Planctomycetota bacterium]
MRARIFLALTALLLAPACAAPPANPGNFGKTTFAARDGVHLFEQAAALVVVHGLKDHSSRYADLAKALVARGFAVHAFDLRGHGRSGGDRVWVDDFSQYLDDLDVFLARVRAAEPGRPIFLMGHSMGGAIVALYAIEKQPAIAGLVLSAPAIRLDVLAPTRASAHAASTLTPRLAIMSLDDDRFSRDAAVVKAMREDPLVYDDNGPARTAGELLNAISEIQDRMEELRAPLLILHGTADEITSPEGSRELARRAGSTDKTLDLYDGYYHDLLHEPAPDRARVLADLTAWLVARTGKK